MKYCTSCGKELSMNSLFCSNCGNDMKNTASPVKTPRSTISLQKEEEPVIHSRTEKNNKRPLTWLAIAAMSLIVLAAVSFFAISTIFSPAKALQKVNEHYVLENKLEFYNSFNIPSGTVGGKDEFYSAMKYWDTIYPTLQTAIETNDVPFEITDANGERILLATVTTDFGIIKRLQLAYSPKELALTVAEKQTSVTVDGQQFLTVANNESFTVPFIPGKYKLAITSNEKSKEEIIYVEQQKDNQFTVAPFAEAPTETAAATPTVTQTVVAQVEQKPTLTMNSYANIDEIHGFFDQYRSDYEAALYYIEPSYIQSYFANNALYNEFKKFIDGHYAIPGYEYTFGTNEITKMVPIDENSFYVYTYETFYFYSDEDGTYYYERSKRYTTKHNGGNFKFINIETLDTNKSKQ
ncbi:TcaA NTF2-like domain-containing protein [Caryophanon latum]|uniref:Uncharacterized protein n=1 Tax=Caryophanon latum TaxID=33977 RepID=A0A1C0YV73_9BACL|nr:zinc ribbon domain-containing protein [Caryophanon latum]OCS91073.1 hypothetical protein A6K76_10030 [Caryophanon latum]